jgi:hypothetical protein
VEVDATQFETLATEGQGSLHAGDFHRAVGLLRQALGLWRGPALADFAYESFAQAEAARFEESRLAVLEDRIDADLGLGEHARLVGELEGLVREHPPRERSVGQLMLALYRSGRQMDALEVYRQTSELFRDELGLEPSPQLPGAGALDPQPGHGGRTAAPRRARTVGQSPGAGHSVLSPRGCGADDCPSCTPAGEVDLHVYLYFPGWW